jgi:hypothetical protein
VHALARRVLAAWVLAVSLVAAPAGAADAQVPPPQNPVFLPAELTVTNPPGQPVITPEQARVVTIVIWWMRESSRALRQENSIPLIETGAAKELDDSWMQGRLGSWAAEHAPRQVEAVSVALPRQYQFPAFFIAHLNSSGERTSTARFGQFLVFTRATGDGPWQLAIETFTRDYDSEALVLPNPDAEGYVPAAPVPNQPTGNVPRAVAEFLQHWFAAGAPPPGSPVVGTPDATSRGRGLFDRRHVAGIAVSDARFELPDRPQPDALFQIDSPSGFTLVCYSMHYAEVRDGSWWRPVGLHRSAAGEPPDGAYLRVRNPVLEQDCVVVNASSRITLVADQTAYEPRTAVAAPVPWFPIGAAGLALIGMVAMLVLVLRPGRRPATPASPTPYRQLGVDSRVRSLGTALAAGLVFAQVEGNLLLYVPLAGVAFAVLVSVWLGLRLWRRRRRAVIISARIEIPRTPDKIFDFVAALGNHLVWSTDLEAVEPLTAGPPGVGSRYRFRQRMGDDRRIEFVTEVIDYQPGWRFETVLDDGLHHQTTTYTLRPVKGGTEVTSALRIELGPLGALAGDESRSGVFKRFIKTRRLEGLQRLRAILTDPTGSAPPPGPPEGPPLKGPSLLKVAVVLSLVTGLVTLSRWWPLTLLCWVLEGFCLIVCIHEFAHFFEARRQGNHPDLPVLTGWTGAAVKPHPLPPTGVALAQMAAAGPIAGALAAAASLILYGQYHWSGFLWWAVGSSVVTLAQLYPLTGTDGQKFLAPSARWFAPVGLALGIGAYVILMLAGLSSVLLAAAVVIGIGARLAPVVRVPYSQASAPVGLSLGFGWAAVSLYTGFVLMIGVNWLLPLS